LQPNVEIMIATAMSHGQPPLNDRSIAGHGGDATSERFGFCRGAACKIGDHWPARTSVVTSAVPAASDKGEYSRLGSFTSPAVKVMLFQASEENSEPTCGNTKGNE